MKATNRGNRGIRKRLIALCIAAGLMIALVIAQEAIAQVITNSEVWKKMFPDKRETVIASPTPTPMLPAVRLTGVQVVCDEHDFLDIRFVAQEPPEGNCFWVFAVPRDAPKWFPSAEPISNGEGNYRARIYIGAAYEYDVYVLLLPQQRIQEVIGYLAARKVDWQWWRGMASRPEGAVLRAEEFVVRECSSRLDMPTSVTATPTATADEASE